MNAASIRPWLPPLLVTAGVSAIIASMAGIGTVTGWLPAGALGGAAPAPRNAGLAPETAPKGTGCATCGVVESVREAPVKRAVDVQLVAGGAAAESLPEAKRISYRVTVRMDDGSYRTLSQLSPPAVGVGDAVRVVDGAVVTRP